MNDHETLVHPVELRECISSIFSARGMRPEDAESIADVLIWADAGGHVSHGVSRVERYLKFIEAGDLNPTAQPEMTPKRGAIARIDGHQSAGRCRNVFRRALANEMADSHGIGFCVVRETTHIGAAGYYAEALARKGKIGIVFAASGPMMAYHGAAAKGVSTAPLAFGIPAGNGPPILLDMACSVAALGKIREAAALGEPIPMDWALGPDGQPTKDPAQAKVLLPLGGAKGSGLALMFECVASLLAGAPLLAPALTAKGRSRHSQNAVLIAVDVAHFIEPDTYSREIAELVTALRSLPKRDDRPILLPGERSQALRSKAMKSGILVRRDLMKELLTLCD